MKNIQIFYARLKLQKGPFSGLHFVPCLVVYKIRKISSAETQWALELGLENMTPPPPETMEHMKANLPCQTTKVRIHTLHNNSVTSTWREPTMCDFQLGCVASKGVAGGSLVKLCTVTIIRFSIPTPLGLAGKLGQREDKPEVMFFSPLMTGRENRALCHVKSIMQCLISKVFQQQNSN